MHLEDSDCSEDEVVEILGFPTEFLRTLVPLEEVPAPDEVCILSFITSLLIIDF